KLVQLLTWDSVLGAESGDVDGAVNSLRAGLAISNTLASEPLLMSEMVRIACIMIVIDAIERIVSATKLSLEQLSVLESDLNRTEQYARTSLARAVIGERALAIPVFRMDYKEVMDLETDEPAEILRGLVADFLRALAGSGRDQALYLRIMAQCENAATD